MKFKILKFERQNNWLKITLKGPKFAKFSTIADYFNDKYSDGYKTYLGTSLDADCNIVLTFVLREVN